MKFIVGYSGLCHAFAWLLLACACQGCTYSTDDVIRHHGEPDMTYETAGDLGRWYIGSDPGEYKWNNSHKKFYYEESNTVYIFTNGSLIKTAPMAATDHGRLKRLKGYQSTSE